VRVTTVNYMRLFSNAIWPHALKHPRCARQNYQKNKRCGGQAYNALFYYLFWCFLTGIGFEEIEEWKNGAGESVLQIIYEDKLD